MAVAVGLYFWVFSSVGLYCASTMLTLVIQLCIQSESGTEMLLLLIFYWELFGQFGVFENPYEFLNFSFYIYKEYYWNFDDS